MILRRRKQTQAPRNVLTFSETFELPRDEVFALLRDRLGDIAPFVPDIRSITCIERVEEGTTVSLKNRWRADKSIPLIARPFISPDMLSWIDRNVWDESDWSTRWWFDAPAPFDRAVECTGRNVYEELPGGRCRLVSEGTFTIDLSKIPGVPRLFHRASREVEAFLVKLVTPNLSRLAEGLKAYLAAQARPGMSQ